MTAPVLVPERLFSFVDDRSPFGAALEALREQAAARRLLPPPGGRHLVRAEVKGVQAEDGWRLDRFSVCSQTWEPGPRPLFSARTFYWRDGHGPASWRELPDEPYLEGLAAALPAAGQPVADDHEVLRYVPLRRFTWRASGLVHKVKRRSRLHDSLARVAAVVAAAEGTAVRVPALRGATSSPASYRQEVVDGTPLSDAAADDLPARLAEAGEVHAAFGELPVRGLPEQPPAACAPDVATTSRWVAFLLPQLEELMARTRAALLARTPGPDPDAVATCHGDLVPSHLLGRPGRWSVIDLDLAHRGDRYRDLAMFLAGLPGDVPVLAGPPTAACAPLLAAAEQAYLSAYAARWGRPVDPWRLAWHRAAAELHHLSLMVTKDRLEPAALARACDLLEQQLLPALEARR